MGQNQGFILMIILTYGGWVEHQTGQNQGFTLMIILTYGGWVEHQMG